MNTRQGTVIECRGDPIIPKGYMIKRLQQLPDFAIARRVKWSRASQEGGLQLVERQRHAGRCGADIFRAFRDASNKDFYLLATAHVCDWLVENPDQVPAAYMGLTVVFWGTVFEAWNIPVTYVKALRVTKGGVESVMLPIGGHFTATNPACIIRLPRD